jgi:hypothetical protein
MKCLVCNGRGKIHDGGWGQYSFKNCGECNGSGLIDQESASNVPQGGSVNTLLCGVIAQELNSFLRFIEEECYRNGGRETVYKSKEMCPSTKITLVEYYLRNVRK